MTHRRFPSPARSCPAASFIPTKPNISTAPRPADPGPALCRINPAGPGAGAGGLQRHRLRRDGAGGFLAGPIALAATGAVPGRAEHHPRLHPDQYVSQAVGAQRAVLPGLDRSPDRAGLAAQSRAGSHRPALPRGVLTMSTTDRSSEAADSQRRSDEIRRRRTAQSHTAQQKDGRQALAFVAERHQRALPPPAAAPASLGRRPPGDGARLCRPHGAFQLASGRIRAASLYNVSLNAPGAEMRLPALPRFGLSWRLASFILLAFLAGALYYLWTAPALPGQRSPGQRLAAPDPRRCQPGVGSGRPAGLHPE